MEVGLEGFQTRGPCYGTIGSPLEIDDSRIWEFGPQYRLQIVGL